MAGFLIDSLNIEFEHGLFEVIIERLLYCSKLMKDTCIINEHPIDNDENKIRNHLLANYLNNKNYGTDTGLPDICLRFIPEAQENYNDINDTYSGRADIKVIAENWFKDSSDYYLIECKRIDGSNDLNKKYVSEGIARFIIPPIKYISRHHRNIMLAFVVKNINISDNVVQINKIQYDYIDKLVKDELIFLTGVDNEYCVYRSLYSLDNGVLELRHIFYNFNEILIY